ncbi:Hypothetical_protein [Hexamita inflata]|uniref:Hypothetical_protein n=1 Tax=Hexamita inflata TaxID=28002 RepID=A0AA86PIM7_9EUKA|nr:Hypothetical protein HINF_LOCUS26756 [Hexamita inflata]CAI9964987.1 Hypothetical protein HINF_LOCUS52632 [Hexamita inflata]
MDSFARGNLQLIRAQIGHSTRPQRPDWTNVIAQLPVPIKQPRQLKCAITVNQTVTQRSRHYEFGNITSAFEIPQQYPHYGFVLVNEQNEPVTDQQNSLGFDELQRYEQQNLQLQIPLKKITIVHRDIDYLGWETSPFTPQPAIQIKAPFSALIRPQIMCREPFSPQYHIQSMYRHIALDTPGTLGLRMDCDNFSHIDEPPLQERNFDRPPKMPKK